MMRKTTSMACMMLVRYVDDILLTNSDEASISTTKAHVQTHFVTRDLQISRYFLGIEFS